MDRLRLPESVVTPPTSPEAKPSGSPTPRGFHVFTNRLHALVTELFKPPIRPSTPKNTLGNQNPNIPRYSRRRSLEVGGAVLTAVGMALGAETRSAKADDGTSGTGTTAEPPTSNGPDSGADYGSPTPAPDQGVKLTDPDSGVAGMQDGPDGIIVKSPLEAYLAQTPVMEELLTPDGVVIGNFRATEAATSRLGIDPTATPEMKQQFAEVVAKSAAAFNYDTAEFITTSKAALNGTGAPEVGFRSVSIGRFTAEIKERKMVFQFGPSEKLGSYADDQEVQNALKGYIAATINKALSQGNLIPTGSRDPDIDRESRALLDAGIVQLSPK